MGTRSENLAPPVSRRQLSATSNVHSVPHRRQTRTFVLQSFYMSGRAISVVVLLTASIVLSVTTLRENGSPSASEFAPASSSGSKADISDVNTIAPTTMVTQSNENCEYHNRKYPEHTLLPRCSDNSAPIEQSGKFVCNTGYRLAWLKGYACLSGEWRKIRFEL